MKRALTGALIFFLATNLLIYSYTPSGETKVGKENIKTIMLDDFESPAQWTAKYSKYRSQTWKDTGAGGFEDAGKWMIWKTIDDLPVKIETLTFEYHVLGKVEDAEKNFLLSIYKKDATGKEYVLKDNLTEEENKKVRDIMNMIRFRSANFLYSSRPEIKGMEGKQGTTIMGVRGKFNIGGYNRIYLEPKQDLYMMGLVDSIRVWVWGGNYDYDLYVVIKNFRNKYYTLYLGNLRFRGWKQMSVKFLGYNIEQVDQWVPQIKPLQFVRFMIVSKINEKPDRFGIWLDDLQYDADLFDQVYPGKALEKELDWD
ncbi:MAG TPA: hypothetical protein DHW82_08190 [Spirochaetia bacterium]|nr:MAG: hypothetical protein A2Y41_11695 [Spirochaetes bacterium GWB1_36_13]HCL56972.1 hypothetical protein [Spirochaetia bacterium]